MRPPGYHPPIDSVSQWGPHVVCLLVCAVATATDLKHMKIPNWLTFSGIALGLVLNPGLIFLKAGGADAFRYGLMPALIGTISTFVFFAALGLRGYIGLGDVKLFTAVGALLKFPLVLYAVAYTMLFGAILALIYALARGQLGSALRHLRGSVGETPKAAHRFPYALAIFLGTALCVAGVYFPALNPWHS